MSSATNAMPGAMESGGAAPVAISWGRQFYWSVLREIWENRSVYLAPLIVAGLFLAGFILNVLSVRHRTHGMWPFNPAHQHDLLASRYEIAAALIMGTVLIVGVFYSLDALYGERRDRSILFWKSLPVSDLTVVLAKFTIPIVVLPLVAFVITVATQFIMLVLSSVLLAGSGVDIARLWAEASFIHVAVIVFYHLLTVHGLWYAPLYAWLFLVSAWAPRAPFMWAFLPPFVICGVEKMAFDTSHFLSFLLYRLAGPDAGTAMTSGSHADFMSQLIPVHFFAVPALWEGVAVAAVFIAAAARLRRYRGPI